MPTRRDFIRSAAGLTLGLAAAPIYAAGPTAVPRLTFYGATRQVSGSCHMLETSKGLYVVDCGLFISDVPDPVAANRELPFDPKEVKALYLTHAHTDHVGRLPLLYKKGYRGPVYCTDATRDLSTVMLKLSASVGNDADEEPIYDRKDVDGLLTLLKAVPYNKKLDATGLTVRYTDAGHILGSAMIEVWTDDRKILFSGDIGPDTAPVLHSPTQHYGADAVLVESTYGPVPRPKFSYEDFGKRVAGVIKRGGSVLLPSFALHKAQSLVYVLHKMVADGILPKDVPIYCDSSTAHTCTRIYDAYPEYHDAEARKFAGKDSLFYRGRYRELRPADSMKTHNGDPAIYISTSGMLAHAAAPKHLFELARDPKNAVLIPGYQAPDTLGRKLLDGEKVVQVPWEETKDGKQTTQMKETEVKLEVDKVTGFSSHAPGQQILEWLGKFERVGPVYVVHGDEGRATGMAEAATKMKLEGIAPKKGETFVVKGDRAKPGPVPALAGADQPAAPAPIDK